MDSILFLGFDGCLHPDDVHPVDGIPALPTKGAWSFKHSRLLADLVAPYPELRIVLTASSNSADDFGHAKAALQALLPRRVIGSIQDICGDFPGWSELSRWEQIQRYASR